ncbi:MAG: ribose-phosphate diphosphokinase, partial [Clostridia bacterium]|nr:ribose-phosphate diphosphokinase [Clostridia bacterium]
TGISRVISVDLHTQQIQGFFEIPVKNIETSELFGKYFAKRFNELKIAHENVCVVSPDHGSANRGRDVSSELSNASLAVIDKRRPAPNKSEIVNVVGDVKDKVCLIVDDIVDTGGTINNAVDALLEKGATKVFVAATHAILSKGKLNSKIVEFVTTDTIETEHKGAKVLSVAELIAQNL